MKTQIIRGATWKYEDLNPQQEEVVLLVHGHPFDHTMWTYQCEALQEYRLLLPDLKGYGASDYDFEQIFIEEQTLDLVLLLDALGIEQVHLVGLSMGGEIIVEFQRLFPQRVKSLVICASLPYAETPKSRLKRLALANRIQEIGMEAYVEGDIHKYISLEYHGRQSQVFEYLFRMMTGTSVAGAVASHRGRAERRDNRAYLPQIKVPTLVVAGREDFFFPVEAIASVAQAIPTAKFLVIEQCRHLPNMEQPEAFNAALLDFYAVIG